MGVEGGVGASFSRRRECGRRLGVPRPKSEGPELGLRTFMPSTGTQSATTKMSSHDGQVLVHFCAVRVGTRGATSSCGVYPDGVWTGRGVLPAVLPGPEVLRRRVPETRSGRAVSASAGDLPEQGGRAQESSGGGSSVSVAEGRQRGSL